MNLSRRSAIKIGIVVAAIIMMIASASAQILAPQPIDTPIKDEWREPLATFLRDLGVKDTAALVDRTYTLGTGDGRGSIAFRVEHEATCFEDRCLTVIGRIAGNKFISEAMFAAGKRYTHSDHAIKLFGVDVVPVWFVGETITVTVVQTPQGWFVIPGLTPKETLVGPGKQ